jgi:hypothetical protein
LKYGREIAVFNPLENGFVFGSFGIRVIRPDTPHRGKHYQYNQLGFHSLFLLSDS